MKLNGLIVLKKKLDKMKIFGDNRIFNVFLMVFIAVSFITLIIFKILFDLNYVNIGGKDNTLALGGALIQSQASILAIVVSLTLVAVQLSSQKYSPRIISIFSKKTSFWFLIGFFGISILFDILLLWIANDVGFKGTLIAILLMIMAFSSLIIYLNTVIEVLRPNKLFEMLSEAIEPSEICDFLFKEGNLEDPLIVISDIVYNAIDSHDQITIITGIKSIEHIFKRTVEFIISCSQSKDEDSKSQFNDGDLTDVIDYFGEIITDVSIKCIENRLIKASIYTIDSMSNMFKIVAKLDNESYKDTSGEFIDKLNVIDSEVESSFEDTFFKGSRTSASINKLIWYPIDQIGENTKIAIQQKHNPVIIEFSINFLRDVGKKYIDHPREFKTFSDVYIEDHPFKGSSRFHVTVNSIIGIKEELTKSLITNKNFEEDYMHGISYLGIWQSSIRLLEDYGKGSLKNGYKYLLEKILDSLFKDLSSFANVNYSFIRENDIIGTVSEVISNILTSNNFIIKNDIYNNIYLKKIEILCIDLIERKSPFFEDLLKLLLKLYDFAFKYEDSYPVKPLINCPVVLGNLGLTCIDKDDLKDLSTLSKKLTDLTKKYVTNNKFWIAFAKTIINYMSLWILELKKGKDENNANQILNNLKEIDNHLKTIQSNTKISFVKKTLTTIKKKKEFQISHEKRVYSSPTSFSFEDDLNRNKLKNEDLNIFEEILNEF